MRTCVFLALAFQQGQGGAPAVPAVEGDIVSLVQRGSLISQIVLAILVLFSAIYGQNVGVGTNNPTEKLQVNGNINLEGNLKINGVAGFGQRRP